MLHGRMPAVAERVTTTLAREDLVVGCLSEVQAARTLDMVSLTGQIGQSCVWASDIHHISLNQASGRTVGSTTRLRLPTHTIGRPWY